MFAKSNLIDEGPEIRVYSNKHTTKLERLDFQRITPIDDEIGEISKSYQGMVILAQYLYLV